MRETMLDRGKFWTPASDWTTPLKGDGFAVRRAHGLGQTLVSGDLSAAFSALAPDATEVGLWQVAAGECYRVRIARDRALLVTRVPLEIAACWRDGFVATPCDDAFAVIDIEGDAVVEIVAEATSADLEAGSPSAAVSFAGVTAFLYRVGGGTARLHLESPLAPYIWDWLEARR